MHIDANQEVLQRTRRTAQHDDWLPRRRSQQTRVPNLQNDIPRAEDRRVPACLLPTVHRAPAEFEEKSATGI